MVTNAMFLLIAALLVAGILLVAGGLRAGRMLRTCRACGNTTSPGGRFCAHCGASLDTRK